MTECYFENCYLQTKVYLLEDLTYGHTIEGPSIIIDKNRYWMSHVNMEFLSCTFDFDLYIENISLSLGP